MLEASFTRFALVAVMALAMTGTCAETSGDASDEANQDRIAFDASFPYDVNMSRFVNVYTEDGDYQDCDFEEMQADVPARFLATIDLSEGCDYDGFRFKLESDRDVTIVTNSVGDTTIQLIDCFSEAILGCDDDSNPGCASGYCSQIDGCLEAARDYCVRVRPFSAGSVFDYALDILDNGDCTAQSPPVVTSDMALVCADPSGGTFNDMNGCQSDYCYGFCFHGDPFFTGACCLAPHSQRICEDDFTPEDCWDARGLYAWDGSDCSDPLLCDALLVTFDSLSAVATATGVEVRWTTAVEIDTVAFRVLRESGRREKTLHLVGEVLASGSDVEGQAYALLDDTPAAFRAKRYYLEDIDVYGKITRHGPVVVERPGPTGFRSGD